MERLDREIRMIQQMKFPGYLLIVWDFIRFAKSQGIPVGPGRGSAAGSLVSYAMGITDIDPLQYGLLFERFLNPERVNLPDIDIDFCMNRRGEVIQYVTEKYGREQVAQIITFNTLGARAAIKDVGRALDLSFADVDRVTKLIPNVLNITLEQAMKMEPGMAEAGRKDPRVAEVLEVARRVEGMCRNASIHAAGVVISPLPLLDLVPLYRTNREEIVTQFDMNGLEKLSLLEDGLPRPDHADHHSRHAGAGREEPRREAGSRGPAAGRPSHLRDLHQGSHQRGIPVRIAGHAGHPAPLPAGSHRGSDRARTRCYRPGPIQGGMIDDFIDRKHGRKEVAYDLPELKEILEETYGVIVYQEQVMQISNRLAGYSLGEADILRRAMGKKKAEEMAAQRAKFLKAPHAKGLPQRKVAKIFDLMEQFAGYGFNKSHSAAYAYLAFVTAYLKAHYPLDFMAALLTSETGNTAKIVKYISECQEMGIQVCRRTSIRATGTSRPT